MDISITSIIVPPNRQRKQVAAGAIEQLADSIASKGLLHPIVLRKTDDMRFELVCGERRLRACALLAAKLTNEGKLAEPEDYMVPFTLLSDLDPISRREAELEENILRVDLTWQERSIAISELHQLRKEQNISQTIIRTAEELASVDGTPIATVRQEIARARFVAQHLVNPAVAAARTLQEAYKIAARTVEAEFSADLADALGKTSEHILIQADCQQYLKNYKSNVFDLILTDPPYGMGADSFGNAGPSHGYIDVKATVNEIWFSILEYGYHICKPQAHLYMFCDIDNFATIKQAAEHFGWYAWRTPLIWYKGASMGHNPIPERGFRRSYEMLLYAIKGDKPCNMLMSDVLCINQESNPIHPAAKPVQLYQWLIQRSCRPGDAVLDPCAGTGTIFPAASLCKVRATGIEVDENFCKLAKGRMFDDA